MTTLEESDSKTTLHVKGKKVWEAFGNEAGKHVVQRVSKKKYHTSTVAVAVTPIVLPEEFHLDWDQIQIETTKGSGPGGQHKNKTETAVRVRHIPSNTMVFVCKERSQEQNKALALEILASRLKAERDRVLTEEMSDRRCAQMGGGKRSDKRRTYSFINGYVKDHVLDRETKDVDKVMKGKFEKLLN